LEAFEPLAWKFLLYFFTAFTISRLSCFRQISNEKIVPSCRAKKKKQPVRHDEQAVAAA
jgi:hypothetical protein